MQQTQILQQPTVFIYAEKPSRINQNSWNSALSQILKSMLRKNIRIMYIVEPLFENIISQVSRSTTCRFQQLRLLVPPQNNATANLLPSFVLTITPPFEHQKNGFYATAMYVAEQAQIAIFIGGEEIPSRDTPDQLSVLFEHFNNLGPDSEIQNKKTLLITSFGGTVVRIANEIAIKTGNTPGFSIITRCETRGFIDICSSVLEFLNS